ncbi:MAG: DNA methyltransferase [bacterium]
MGKKYHDSTWDFKDENTKPLTHCFHNYPAMMIPQVAGRLLDIYGKGSNTLFDPYCGTGTSLVEANLRNISAVGTDINPLARLIAKTKTTVIRIDQLDKHLNAFYELVDRARFGKVGAESIKPPDFPNINYWFSAEVKTWLSLVLDFLSRIEVEPVRDFFKVAFSETVRDCSWTMNSEFKLVRMPEEKRREFRPDVLGIMESKLARNRAGLINFMNARNGHRVKSRIYNFDTVAGIPGVVFKDKDVDLVITSPPYGDSRTTVAYGQFSRLANQWLGVEEASEVDKLLMGGKRSENGHRFNLEILDSVIAEIAAKDQARSRDVIGFFRDYEKSIENVSSIIKKRGFACYVVGNRLVRGVTIPTDEITRLFFEKQGFKHIETIIRNIPNKRMPSHNSPSNVAGIKSPTMKQEYIVVCQKK